MNKKGFTLIELLAVIVILAIISLIAVPIVLNIISDSKEQSELRSANFYLEALELSIAKYVLEDKKINDGEYKILEDGNLCLQYENDNKTCKEDLKVDIKGEKPKSGIIYIKNGKIYEVSLILSNKEIVKNDKGELEYDSSKEIIVSGVSNLTLLNNKGRDLVNYKIYGESIQNGTPTIDAPIQIQSVGDKTKNLFDEVWEQGHRESASLEKTRLRNKTLFPVKANTTYIVTSNLPSDIYDFNMGISEVNTYWALPYSQDTGWKHANSYVYTPKTDGYLSMLIRRKDNQELTVDDIKDYWFQIEEGNVATDYEPYYDNYKISVKVIGKNLFDLEKLNLTKPYSTSIPERLSNGFKLYHKYAGTGADYTYIAEKDQTLTFSYNATKGDGEGYDPYIWGKLNGKDVWSIKSGKVFELKTGDKLVLYFSWNAPSGYTTTGEESATFTNIQLEEGEVATNYEPYTEITTNIYIDEPLRKIGDFVDYIDFENNKVVRNIKSFTLNGTEAWANYSATPGMYYTSIFKDNIKGSSSGLCSHFIWKSSIKNEGECYIAGKGASYHNFFLRDVNKFPTKDDLLAFLPQNNVEFISILEEPLEEKVELPNIKTYKGTNTIKVETTVQPSNLEIVHKGK